MSILPFPNRAFLRFNPPFDLGATALFVVAFSKPTPCLLIPKIAVQALFPSFVYQSFLGNREALFCPSLKGFY